MWVDGVRERVESAREQLLKRPRALEGTSVAAMDVARATKSGHATGHMAKKAQALHPFGGRTNFLPRGHVDGSALSKYLRKYAARALVFAPVK